MNSLKSHFSVARRRKYSASLSLFSCYDCLSQCLLVSACAVKFFVDVEFEIGFSYPVQRNSDLPVSSIVKQHVVSINSQQRPPEVPLSVDWLASLHLRLASCKTLVIR